MEDKLKCNVCGRRDFSHTFNLNDKANGGQKIYSLLKCTNCGVIVIYPLPSLEESKNSYEGGYYSFNRISDRDSRKTKVKLLLYDIYFKKKNPFLKMLLSPLRPMLRGAIPKEGLKILDIGCGSGQFLYEMKQFGMDVYGIEPGRFDKESAKKHGIKIKHGYLAQDSFPEKFFDVITLNHVLEHVDNPNILLRNIRRSLKDNGVLFIGVPNTSSLAYRLFGKNWYQLDVPRHLINYSDSNLDLLLTQNGFRIFDKSRNSRVDQFSLSMLYFLGWKRGKIFLDLIFFPLYLISELMGVSDQIEVRCQKS